MRYARITYDVQSKTKPVRWVIRYARITYNVQRKTPKWQ